MPESGKKFAMPTISTMTKLAPTAAGRTKFMLYCYLWAEYGNIQHGKDGTGRHWFYASWGEIADATGMSRETVKRAARGLQRDGLLEIKARHQRHGYEANDMRVRFDQV
jgi:DNA-binding MarR family transcriptional regulator